MTLFNLNYLLKDLFPNIDTLEVRALTYEWGGRLEGCSKMIPLISNNSVHSKWYELGSK